MNPSLSNHFWLLFTLGLALIWPAGAHAQRAPRHPAAPTAPQNNATTWHNTGATDPSARSGRHVRRAQARDLAYGDSDGGGPTDDSDVGGRSFETARERTKHEPPVSETMQAALRYFRVDPKNFDRLRRTANTRALLPTFAAGFRLDDTTFDRTETQRLSNPRDNQENRDTNTNTISIGAVWDFRELIFNPAEVQVYGLIGVQRDLMLETTRIYYLRKQLFVRFLNSPPQDPLAREALLLRVDEFTALLDVLTGGWFSKATDSRYQAARGGGRGRRPSGGGGETGRASGTDAYTAPRPRTGTW